MKILKKCVCFLMVIFLIFIFIEKQNFVYLDLKYLDSSQKIDTQKIYDFQCENESIFTSKDACFASVNFEGNSINSNIVGTDFYYDDVFGLEIINGSFFNYDDFINNSNVCVIDENVALLLFGNTCAINTNININGCDYNVIGIAKTKGRKNDLNIFIPLKNYSVLFDDTDVNQLIFNTKNDVYNIDKAINELQLNRNAINIKVVNITKVAQIIRIIITVVILLIAIVFFINDLIFTTKEFRCFYEKELNKYYTMEIIKYNKRYFIIFLINVLLDIVLIVFVIIIFMLSLN